MIKVEKISRYEYEVHVTNSDLRKEFALAAAAVLNVLPLEEVLEIVRLAADHTADIRKMNDVQSKKFSLRLFHLIELNNMTMNELIVAENIPEKDVRAIKEGIIPSLETVKKIAKRFGVTHCYLFGVENETDQRTD